MGLLDNLGLGDMLKSLLGQGELERFAGADQCGAGEDPIS